MNVELLEAIGRPGFEDLVLQLATVQQSGGARQAPRARSL